MRHLERELRDKETIKAMLDQSPVGRIATINRQGIPVIKPVNFLFDAGKIYIHSSKKGEKIGDIRRGSPVCFEIDEPIAFVPAKGPACKASYYFRSIIAKGKATLINKRDKKLEILERMMEKYQAEGGYEAIPEEILRKTALIEIAIEKITGKENLE